LQARSGGVRSQQKARSIVATLATFEAVAAPRHLPCRCSDGVQTRISGRPQMLDRLIRFIDGEKTSHGIMLPSIVLLLSPIAKGTLIR